tara:strand:+ start:507 stop:1370 length:864 start_codon:yes stop_codon:yes gene_type:complete
VYDLDKVIGLGKLGCAIAEQLTSYPEYRIYKIDSEIAERGSLSIGFFDNMENYEKGVDPEEVSVYLRSIKQSDEVLLILEGGEPISGAVLKILETIKDTSLNVLYVSPDRQMISEVQKRDDKICFNVLQEYARSGKFESILLVDKTKVEELAGHVPVNEYENTISYFISYVVAMINFFKHTKPILANPIKPASIARLVTYGVSSLEEDKKDINLLFPLSDVADIHFFYGIPKEELEADASLVKKIKEHVKSYKSEEVSTSFSVYETTLENMIVLCVAYSAKIQPLSS